MRPLVRVASLSTLAVVVFGVAACSLSRNKEEPRESPPVAALPIATTKLERSSPPLRESGGLAGARLQGGAALVFLADADDHALVAIDPSTLETKLRADLEGTPEQLIVLPTGEVAVTLVDAALVVVYGVRGNDLVETRRARTGSEPRALAVTPDDRMLLVTAGAAHRVQAFDVGSLDLRWSKEVPREPRAIAVSDNGKKVLVTHATSSETTILDLDDPDKRTSATLRLPAVLASCSYSDPGRVARHANALVRKLHKDNAESFLLPVVQSASHGVQAHGYGAERVDVTPVAFRSVSGNVYGLAAFDVREVHTESSKSDAPRFTESRWLIEDCQLPRAAIGTARGLLVACEGQSEVIEVTRTAGRPEVATRFKTGRGPSALVELFDGKEILAWSRFDRKLTVLGPARERVLARMRPADERVERGKEIFHRTGDKRISRSGVACATCHPDGRDDGIVWAAPGGDRRTLVLAGNIAERSAYGWQGEHTTIEKRIAATIERLEGKGLPAEEVEALAAYLVSLKRPAPAAAIEGDAVRGKDIFASSKAGCVSCHAFNATYTDHQPHDVGSGGAFLTPSLVGVGARKALFHDGRYGDIETLLKSAKSMGGAAELDDDERAAVAAFLRAL